MLNYTVRTIKRFVVLLPGIAIAYFSTYSVFPALDRRLPFAISVSITYVLAAYILVPALLRLFRIIKPAKHLPLYCVTPDGYASDPLNIGVIGSKRQLIIAMKKIGWHQADKRNIRNTLRVVVSGLMGRHYRSAPLSRLYLFGRKQDVAFESTIDETLGNRHHVRFWATTYDQKNNAYHIHWHRRSSSSVGKTRLLWVGAASRDVGITLIRHNFQLTHMVDPDTDSERELIVTRLKEIGLNESVHTIRLGDAYTLVNRAWRGFLKTDGKLTIVKLKRQR